MLWFWGRIQALPGASSDLRGVTKPLSLSFPMWDMGPKNTTDFRGSVYLKLSPEQGLAHSGPSRPAWEAGQRAGRPPERQGHLGREPLPHPGWKSRGAPLRPKRGAASSPPSGPRPPRPAARAQCRRGACRTGLLLLDPRDRRPPGPPQAAAPSASTPSIQAA